MFNANLGFIIYHRGKNAANVAEACGVSDRSLRRFKSIEKKDVYERHYDCFFKVAKHLDIHPADLFFMNRHDFRFKYQDPNVKEYVDVKSNFLFNVKLIMNNHPNKKRLYNRLYEEYHTKGFNISNTKRKVNRKLNKDTQYTLKDVIIFSKVLNYKPELLLFGIV